LHNLELKILGEFDVDGVTRVIFELYHPSIANVKREDIQGQEPLLMMVIRACDPLTYFCLQMAYL
jgi:hypothetical protein